MIRIHDIEQGTEEWLELRADLYTGSNAYKLLEHAGKSKMTNGIVRPYAVSEDSGFKGNFYTKRGHVLEDEAIYLYQKIRKIKVHRPGFVTNDEFPECGYSPDGLTIDRTIEVKAFNEDKHRKMLNGDVPLTVLAQVHFGMMICEKEMCDLIIYNPNIDNIYEAFRKIPIKFNEKIANNFKRILKPKVAA